MRLTKIVNKGIKGLKSEFDLGEVNLISGDNRSGKTAIISAIQACCTGNVDKVGSANNKLAFLIGESRSAGALLSIDGGYELEFSVAQGKTASTKRTIRANGVALDSEVAEATLFGGVPQSTKQLFAMSGEELWNLMMPQGDGSAPNEIVSYYNAAKKSVDKVGLKADGVRECLENKDLGVAANGGLQAAKELLSKIKQEVKAAELMLSTDVPDYDGPPKSEIENNLSAIKDRLKSHNDEKKRLVETTKDIERLEEIIKRANEQKPNNQEEQLTQSLSDYENIVTLANECIKTQPNNCPAREMKLALSRFSEAFNELIAIQNIDGSNNVKKWIDEVDAWVSKKSQDLEDSERTRAAKKLRKACGGSVNLHTCENFPSVVLNKYIAEIESVRNKIKELGDKREADRLALNTNIETLGFLKAKAFNVLDAEAVKALITESNEYEAKLSQIMQVELLEERRRTTGERITLLTKASEAVDELIDSINRWRRDIIDGAIETICKTANKKLAAIGMPGINIKLSQGKRSAAIIETEDGVNLCVLSGAEETIYGTALLYAIHKFRNVNCPIIFVEGGELSDTYLPAYLTSYVGAGVNMVVAHYLSPEVDGVNLIEVGEKERFTIETLAE